MENFAELREVLACSNGMEAIEQARQNAGPIQLLLTDVSMPDMGGAELAELFALCRREVPVLFMGSHSTLASPGSADSANYLQGPFTPAVLLARVRAVLDHTAESH